MNFSPANIAMIAAVTLATVFVANMAAGRSPQARRLLRGASVSVVPNKPIPNKPIAV